MGSVKQSASTAESIHDLVEEINHLTVVGGVADLLASDPVLLEQITVVNLCAAQLGEEEGDELLEDELQAIVTRLRAAAEGET